MIPRAAKLGRSFQGCAAYLLHDKRSELSTEFANASDPEAPKHLKSSDRVVFTETVNLFTDDPRLAVAAMIDTAKHAAALKKANGGRARAVEKPVYHYSLAWPREDTHEPPSKADMLEAVQESMKALGIEDRQALVIAHNDEKHPHIHVMVNTVHPETGYAAKLSNDHNKLSRWAQKYDKERGLEHLCPQRAVNNDRRAEGEFVKYDGMTRKEWEQSKLLDNPRIPAEHLTLDPKSPALIKAELQAHWAKYREDKNQRYKQSKAAQKPEWRELFKRQNKELKDFDLSLTGRVKEAFRQNKGGRGVIGAAVRALFGSYGVRRDMVRRHADERATLAADHRMTRNADNAKLLAEYKAVGNHIIKTHRAAEAEMFRSSHPAARQKAIDKRLAQKAEQEIKAARRVPAKGAKRVLDAEQKQKEHREAPRPARDDVRGQFAHSGRKPPRDPQQVQEAAEKKARRASVKSKRTIESEKARRQRNRKRKPRKSTKGNTRDFGQEIE